MNHIDQTTCDRCINTLRFLAADEVETASSGHPGMPLGAAAMAFVLWHDFLRYDPDDPGWTGRDRFILSAGHASSLLYALLCCAGTGLSLDELRSFRQWGSRTPGHPERGLTPGVETTAGPLGQGFANGVGMGIAARMTAARLGSAGTRLFDHRIFAIVSDGDMMEGITNEAASIAGHLGLGNLIYLYDSNDITIEGSLSLTMSEDVALRFRGLGWGVEQVDGLDPDAVRGAVARACDDRERPSLVVCRTKIGYGSPKEGSSSCHGSPLGADALAATRARLGWPAEPRFWIPEDVREVWARRANLARQDRAAWNTTYDQWRKDHPDEAARWDALREPPSVESLIDSLVEAAGTKKAATRVISGKVLQRAAALVPCLVGGSADLAPSNMTFLDGLPAVSRERHDGRNIHFGIREHAMAAVVNGMAIHGPWRPYCGTFLVFSDYLRPSLRLAAMMGLPVTHVMTHDSFYVGEDGPTHQPVEHLWALRAIPRLRVFRPADGVEVGAAWAAALSSTHAAHVLALSRQALPPLARPEGFQPRDVLRGAYVISPEAGAQPDLTIVATGSEVSLALEAKDILVARDLSVRVVSMPCVEAFLEQDESYRLRVVPRDCPVVSIEAGITGPWRAVVGLGGLTIGLDDYGASAPPEVLQEKLGFTADQVAARISSWLAGRPAGE
jgi:transketolase